MLTLVTQAALLAMVVSLASAAALVLKDRRPLYVRFAGLALSVSAYYLAVFVDALLPAGGLVRVRLIVAGTIVVTGSLFFEGLLGESGSTAATRRRDAVVVAAFILVLALSPWGTTNVVAVAVAGLLILTLGTRFWQMEQRARRVELAAQRARLRYLAVGGTLALFGAVLDGLPLLGLTWFPSVGGVCVAIYMYFLSQALLRLRLLDLHELLGKAAVLSTLGLILATVFGLFVVWVGDRPGLFLFNTLVASAVILILFEPLRSALEQATTRLFFKEQLDFTLTLRALVREIASVIEVPKVTERVLDVLYDTKRVTHSSVYLLSPDGLSYRLAAHRGPRPATSISHRVHASFFARLDEDRSPLIADLLMRRMLERAPEGGTALSTPEVNLREQNLLDSMEAMRADLCFPIVGHDRVVGMLSLRDERLAEAYSTDEISILAQLAEQMAISLENSEMFERLKERDRLAALGEMAAGLAHEIRNPLGAIKSAAQYLDPASVHGDEAEFLQIIVDEVDRLNHVVSTFLDYARPYRGTFAPFDLNDALQKTVKLLRAREIPPGVRVRLALSRDLARVMGDAEQIRQVILNLIFNAVQAMDGKGRLLISTRPSRAGVDATLQDGTARLGVIELRIKDSGPGITPEVQKRIFIPFFTTKEKGTGLGLAICQRIIQAHGGTIEVRSRRSRGAEFIVKLPVALQKGDIRSEKSVPPPVRDVPALAAPAAAVPVAPAARTTTP
jgi:two-component system sensor histidine kinase HydH